MQSSKNVKIKQRTLESNEQSANGKSANRKSAIFFLILNFRKKKYNFGNFQKFQVCKNLARTAYQQIATFAEAGRSANLTKRATSWIIDLI